MMTAREKFKAAYHRFRALDDSIIAYERNEQDGITYSISRAAHEAFLSLRRYPEPSLANRLEAHKWVRMMAPNQR